MKIKRRRYCRGCGSEISARQASRTGACNECQRIRRNAGKRQATVLRQMGGTVPDRHEKARLAAVREAEAEGIERISAECGEGHFGVALARRIKDLEDENRELKKALAELVHEVPCTCDGEIEPRVFTLHVAEQRMERIRELVPEPKPDTTEDHDLPPQEEE